MESFVEDNYGHKIPTVAVEEYWQDHYGDNCPYRKVKPSNETTDLRNKLHFDSDHKKTTKFEESSYQRLMVRSRNVTSVRNKVREAVLERTDITRWPEEKKDSKVKVNRKSPRGNSSKSQKPVTAKNVDIPNHFVNAVKAHSTINAEQNLCEKETNEMLQKRIFNLYGIPIVSFNNDSTTNVYDAQLQVESNNNITEEKIIPRGVKVVDHDSGTLATATTLALSSLGSSATGMKFWGNGKHRVHPAEECQPQANTRRVDAAKLPNIHSSNAPNNLSNRANKSKKSKENAMPIDILPDIANTKQGMKETKPAEVLYPFDNNFAGDADKLNPVISELTFQPMEEVLANASLKSNGKSELRPESRTKPGIASGNGLLVENKRVKKEESMYTNQPMGVHEATLDRELRASKIALIREQFQEQDKRMKKNAKDNNWKEMKQQELDKLLLHYQSSVPIGEVIDYDPLGQELGGRGRSYVNGHSTFVCLKTEMEYHGDHLHSLGDGTSYEHLLEGGVEVDATVKPAEIITHHPPHHAPVHHPPFNSSSKSRIEEDAPVARPHSANYARKKKWNRSDGDTSSRPNSASSLRMVSTSKTYRGMSPAKQIREIQSGRRSTSPPSSRSPFDTSPLRTQDREKTPEAKVRAVTAELEKIKENYFELPIITPIIKQPSIIKQSSIIKQPSIIKQTSARLKSADTPIKKAHFADAAGEASTPVGPGKETVSVDNLTKENTATVQVIADAAANNDGITDIELTTASTPKPAGLFGGGGGLLAALQLGKKGLKKVDMPKKVEYTEDDKKIHEERRVHYVAFNSSVNRLYMPIVTMKRFTGAKKLLGRGKFAAVYHATCNDIETAKSLISIHHNRHKCHVEHSMNSDDEESLVRAPGVSYKQTEPNPEGFQFALKLAQYKVFKTTFDDEIPRSMSEETEEQVEMRARTSLKKAMNSGEKSDTFILPPHTILSEYEREITAMTMLKGHVNIVHIYGIILPAPFRLEEEEGDNKDKPYLVDEFNCRLGIVLEHMNIGNLGSVLDDHHWQTSHGVTDRVHIIQGVAAGIAHMHKFNYIHRDLKVHNVMLKESDEIDPITRKPTIIAKLADFGTALHLNQNEMLTDVVGTLGYLAPEVYIPGQYSFPADIFAFAVICWMTFSNTRNNPMANFANSAAAANGETELTSPAKFSTGATIAESGVRPVFGPEHPALIAEMIEGCWNTIPRLRPIARTINGILSNILLTPENIMQVYDRKYAHYLDINKSVCYSDFDPSHYIDNKCFYHDNTTMSVSSKQRRRASMANAVSSRSPVENDIALSPNTSAAAANAAHYFDKLHTDDTALQPRGMMSFMSNIGNQLISSVRDSFPKPSNKVAPITVAHLPTLQPVDEMSWHSNSATPARSMYNSPRPGEDNAQRPTSSGFMSVMASIKVALSPRSLKS